MEKSPGLLRRG